MSALISSIIAFIVAGLAIFGLVPHQQPPAKPQTVRVAQPSGQPTVQQTNSTISPNSLPTSAGATTQSSTSDAPSGGLKVVALHTYDQAKTSDTYKYPATIRFTEGGHIMAQLAAFGAAGELWLGPSGWTGQGRTSTDGNVVYLYPYPPTGDPSSLAAPAASPTGITYSTSPSSCEACVLGGAAAFFPQAAAALKQQFGTEIPSLIKDLKIRKISSSVVTFTFVDHDGLTVYGAAEYAPTHEIGFQLMEAALPANQSGLASYLADHFGASLAATSQLHL